MGHNVRGHGDYLLGQTHQRAIWYYFPVLLCIKFTVPFLLLPVVLTLWRRRVVINWPLSPRFCLIQYNVGADRRLLHALLAALAVVGAIRN